MDVTIESHGNDLIMRIPTTLADKIRIQPVSTVNVSVNDGSLVVHKSTYKRRKYSLKEMLEQITDENRHEPVDWGPPVGREVW